MGWQGSPFRKVSRRLGQRFLTLVVACLGSLMAQATDRHSFSVLTRYPHDPTAFTQGLQMVGDYLIEGTGLFGQSSLRKVELATGNVLQQIDLEAKYFGEGVTVVDQRVFQLTWRAGVAFEYHLDTFELIKTHPYQGEGWGLTHDQHQLIMSNGSATLAFRNIDDFSVERTVEVWDEDGLVRNLNELEWIDGEVWANQWLSDRVARIDPASGQVMAWIDLSGLYDWRQLGDLNAVLNGLAYDAVNKRIYLTGKDWPWLFEVAIQSPKEPHQTSLDIYRTETDAALAYAFRSLRKGRYQIESRTMTVDSSWAASEDLIEGTGHAIRGRLTVDSEHQMFRVVGLPSND